MHIEVRKKVLFHYIIIKAGNGETLLTSEVYVSKGNARRAARTLCRELKIPIKKIA